MAQHQMLLFQGRQQQLVHCADHKVGQQRLLMALKPRVHVDPLLWPHIFLRNGLPRKQFPILLVQLCHTMGQPNGVGHIFRLCLRPGGQSSKDTVGRGLCGQAKEQASCTPFSCKSLRRRQSSLCFSHAHLGLYHQQARALHRGRCLQHGFLHFVGRKSKTLPERIAVHGEREGRLPRRRQIHPGPPLLNAAGIESTGAQIIHREQRKEPVVRGNPVRHDKKARQQDLLRDGKGRQIPHG